MQQGLEALARARTERKAAPSARARAIDTIAAHVQASTSEVVIAVLNDGLQGDVVRLRWNREVRS